jgi:hypothetical protein
MPPPATCLCPLVLLLEWRHWRLLLLLVSLPACSLLLLLLLCW